MRELSQLLEVLRTRLEGTTSSSDKKPQPKGIHPDKVKERERKAFHKGVAAANKAMHAHRKEVHRRVFGGK